LISEYSAISKYIASLNQQSELLGQGLFQESKIDEWISFSQSQILPLVKQIANSVFGVTVTN
jgi:glutathione S-transferase